MTYIEVWERGPPQQQKINAKTYFNKIIRAGPSFWHESRWKFTQILLWRMKAVTNSRIILRCSNLRSIHTTLLVRA
jgi:hypothetical protein